MRAVFASRHCSPTIRKLQSSPRNKTMHYEIIPYWVHKLSRLARSKIPSFDGQDCSPWWMCRLFYWIQHAILTRVNDIMLLCSLTSLKFRELAVRRKNSGLTPWTPAIRVQKCFILLVACRILNLNQPSYITPLSPGSSLRADGSALKTNTFCISLEHLLSLEATPPVLSHPKSGTFSLYQFALLPFYLCWNATSNPSTPPQPFLRISTHSHPCLCMISGFATQRALKCVCISVGKM